MRIKWHIKRLISYQIYELDFPIEDELFTQTTFFSVLHLMMTIKNHREYLIDIFVNFRSTSFQYEKLA